MIKVSSMGLICITPRLQPLPLSILWLFVHFLLLLLVSSYPTMSDYHDLLVCHMNSSSSAGKPRDMMAPELVVNDAKASSQIQAATTLPAGRKPAAMHSIDESFCFPARAATLIANT